MDIQFSALSHGIGALLFLLLGTYASRFFAKSTVNKSIFFASITSGIWLLVLSAQSLGIEIPFYVRYLLELIRNAAWFDVLYALLGVSFIPNRRQGTERFYLSTSILGLLVFIALTTLIQGLTDIAFVSGYSLLLLHIAISVVGLLLLEQAWRHSNTQQRAGARNLIFAIAIMFIYDFAMYSDALLFKEISDAFWETRGAVNAMAVPLIALALGGIFPKGRGMNISRQMLFHTSTLILAGAYLIIISASGYYISAFGGTWGEALRVLFISAGIIVLGMLLSSPALRARVMVFISKNFFDYRYDYREEWIKSTNALSKSHHKDSLGRQVITILADLVGSKSGAIWVCNEDGVYVSVAQKNLDFAKFLNIDGNADLIAFFKQTDWIINLEEYMIDPSKYQLIEIPDKILELEHPWLIIPLGQGDSLSGFVLLCDPITNIDLNWENYDLLKIVSQQACSYITQQASQEKLSTARQFEAVNKASAFLIHDIKTIIAQLSLLVKNAEKHKTNPAFIDDMIQTTSHTVSKMDHLLQQIYNPHQNEEDSVVDLSQLLIEIYQGHRNSTPTPTLEPLPQRVLIKADAEQLKSSIVHIIQNAIDATDKDGEVSIASKLSAEHVFLFIQDSGKGMSEDFIKDELFKPFSSTKGLTGMGIGVYQSREYLRKLGGSIDVTSQLGVGTCFTLKIPVSSSE